MWCPLKREVNDTGALFFAQRSHTGIDLINSIQGRMHTNLDAFSPSFVHEHFAVAPGGPRAGGGYEGTEGH